MKKLRDLLVCMDGGATKTIVQLRTIDGKILTEEKGAPANIANNTKASWNSVITILQSLEARLDLSPSNANLYGGGGFAGADVPTAVTNFIEHSYRFKKLIIQTDAYTSCLGAHHKQDGAIIAVGTGTVAYAISGKQSSKLSGWGFPQDDQGGGAWIGLQLICDMLQTIDGRKEKTKLTQELYNYLREQGHNPMLWAVGATPTQFGSLVPWIVQKANSGCQEANQLLDKAANIISHLARCLLKNEFANLPLCLLGGMSDILRPRMHDKIRNIIIPAKGNSLDGAFYLALEAYHTEKH